MRLIRPRVDMYATPVREAAPQAVGIARGLAALMGPDINGHRGTIRYGYPALGDRQKFTGYGSPPQLFVGYDPRKVAGGTFRGQPGSLPSTSPPASALNSPLQQAMATMTLSQMQGNPY